VVGITAHQRVLSLASTAAFQVHFAEMELTALLCFTVFLKSPCAVRPRHR
jgi:hypothetical protein